ncbi:MAG: hypothetical protein LBB78_09365, partial [Spirochaetaceae bacterium]|nr:hypothetical protein [Spirochaetaceae bacterium]
MTDIQKELYEELEPVEEIEDLEETPGEFFEPEPEDGETSKFFSSVLNPFLNSVFPILLIDNKMRIVYTNSACERLFTSFFNLAGKYFIDIFGKFFEMTAIR